jgi:fumarate hydratase subunit beta
MKEVGCVYLAATGGVAVTYAEGLARVTGHDWADLGMPEALWQFQTKSLGPLIVAIDADGNSLYENVKQKVAENLAKMQ